MRGSEESILDILFLAINLWYILYILKMKIEISIFSLNIGIRTHLLFILSQMLKEIFQCPGGCVTTTVVTPLSSRFPFYEQIKHTNKTVL